MRRFSRGKVLDTGSGEVLECASVSIGDLCGDPELGHNSDSRLRVVLYSKEIIVHTFLGGACFGLFGGGPIGGMDERTPAHKEGLGEFEILQA
jgi:hypothetical protein